MIDKESFPKFDLFPRITQFKSYIGHLLTGPHILSEVSDHDFKHLQHDLEFTGPPTEELDVTEIDQMGIQLFGKRIYRQPDLWEGLPYYVREEPDLPPAA